MVGTFDFEFITQLIDEQLTLINVTIFTKIGNPQNLVPIHAKAAFKGHPLPKRKSG
jgi:hypothetical protein